VAGRRGGSAASSCRTACTTCISRSTCGIPWALLGARGPGWSSWTQACSPSVWIVSLLLVVGGCRGCRPCWTRCAPAIACDSPRRSAVRRAPGCCSPCGASPGWATRRGGGRSAHQPDVARPRGHRRSRVSDRPARSRVHRGAGDRLDADLWVFRDGVLAGTSAPVLGELGLVDPLLARARSCAWRSGTSSSLPMTAARPAARFASGTCRALGLTRGSGDSGRPQLLDDERVRQQQEDLALVLILATLAGLVAAVYLAGLTARGLARPSPRCATPPVRSGAALRCPPSHRGRRASSSP